MSLNAARASPKSSGHGASYSTSLPSGCRKPIRRAVPADVEVKVRHAREGVTSGSPAVRGVWHVEEGPHGELVYEKRETL